MKYNVFDHRQCVSLIHKQNTIIGKGCFDKCWRNHSFHDTEDNIADVHRRVFAYYRALFAIQRIELSR